MSKIETNTIAPSTGTTLTLGENGDTVALGSGATATATVSSNTVTAINITAKGSGYTFANIAITGGGGSSAAANATIAPGKGHGVDPVSELGAFFISINTQLTGAGGSGSDLTVGNDFRQISLIKDPTNFGTTTTATAATLKAMKYLDFASGANLSAFVVDDVITWPETFKEKIGFKPVHTLMNSPIDQAIKTYIDAKRNEQN